MSRFVLAVLVAAVSTPVLLAAPQDGGKAAGFPYPAKAPIVVCLNGYEKARERLTALATAALPLEGPKLVKRLDEGLENLLEGRKLSAVRKDARLFLVINELGRLFEDDQPPLAVLIPVTNYKDFRTSFLTAEELKSIDRGREGVDAIKTAAFGEECPAYLVDLKDYVALTLDRMTADAFAGKFNRASAEQMGPGLAESFLKADLALYVNMDSVNDQFGDQIRGIKPLIDFGLQQAAQQGTLPGFSQKQMDALKSILRGALQGIEDCRAIVAAVEFRPDGLAARVQARFADDTDSAKLISRERPVAFAEIGKMPTGLALYGGVKFGRAISEAVRDISQDLATTAEDAQGLRLIELHRKDLAAAGHQWDYSATAAPGVAITISNYADPEKAVRALTKTYKAIAAGGRVNTVLVKSAPEVRDEAQTLGDFVFSEVRLKFDFAATVADLPEQVREATLQSLKRNATEDTRMWIGTDKKLVVSITAKDWSAAKALLDQYLDGKRSVGAQAGYKLTRAQLPAEANYLLIAETGSALTALLNQLRDTAEFIPGFPRIPEIKRIEGEPTYIGFAVTLKGDTASITIFIPTGALAVGGKILAPLFKNIE
jgi:hypothetical protein